jgi:hypothetical protein
MLPNSVCCSAAARRGARFCIPPHILLPHLKGRHVSNASVIAPSNRCCAYRHAYRRHACSAHAPDAHLHAHARGGAAARGQRAGRAALQHAAYGASARMCHCRRVRLAAAGCRVQRGRTPRVGAAGRAARSRRAGAWGNVSAGESASLTRSRLVRSQAFQPCAADFARADDGTVAEAVAPAPAGDGMTQAQRDRALASARIQSNDSARSQRRAAEMAAQRAVRLRCGVAGCAAACASNFALMPRRYLTNRAGSGSTQGGGHGCSQRRGGQDDRGGGGRWPQ